MYVNVAWLIEQHLRLTFSKQMNGCGKHGLGKHVYGHTVCMQTYTCYSCCFCCMTVMFICVHACLYACLSACQSVCNLLAHFLLHIDTYAHTHTHAHTCSIMQHTHGNTLTNVCMYILSLCLQLANNTNC